MHLYPTGLEDLYGKPCEPAWGLNGWAHVPIDNPPAERREMGVGVRLGVDGVLVGSVVGVVGLVVAML